MIFFFLFFAFEEYFLINLIWFCLFIYLFMYLSPAEQSVPSDALLRRDLAIGIWNATFSYGVIDSQAQQAQPPKAKKRAVPVPELISRGWFFFFSEFYMFSSQILLGRKFTIIVDLLPLFLCAVEVLRNITLEVPKGSLVCFVGAVGSGKSTLLDAILNEVQCDSGRVRVRGQIAFCAQQAWIQNATVKDNIIFGFPFDAARYQKVIDVCALAADLEMLPAGDATEIGERGITLSGGQKQRVSMRFLPFRSLHLFILR
jgi:ABC-type multidrug transport system fused ATPase/permease subunit